MDSYAYIKLIEFQYVLEGYKLLFKSPENRSTIYVTAEQIINEIYNTSIRRVVNEDTKNKLSKKWRDVTLGRVVLDNDLFNEVHDELTTVLDEFITQRYIEDRYLSRWTQAKGSLACSSNASISSNGNHYNHTYGASSQTNCSYPATSSSSLPIPVVANGSSSSPVPIPKPISSTLGFRESSAAACYAVPSNPRPAPASSNQYQSMLTLDSGFQSEPDKNSTFSEMNLSENHKPADSNNKTKNKDQKSKSLETEKAMNMLDSISAKYLKKQCPPEGESVLKKHIKKTFPLAMLQEETLSQRSSSGSQSSNKSNHESITINDHQQIFEMLQKSRPKEPVPRPPNTDLSRPEVQKLLLQKLANAKASN